jgi:hypothetical protein
LYRTAAFVYLICFTVYILFSRQPYYFDSELTPATVVEAKSLDPATLKENSIALNDAPIVQYAVGSDTFYYNGNHNYLQRWIKPFTRVRVIYDEGNPHNADIYQFLGYWIVLKELIFSLAGFAILLAVAIGISSKNDGNDYNGELERQMKYN